MKFLIRLVVLSVFLFAHSDATSSEQSSINVDYQYQSADRPLGVAHGGSTSNPIINSNFNIKAMINLISKFVFLMCDCIGASGKGAVLPQE